MNKKDKFCCLYNFATTLLGFDLILVLSCKEGLLHQVNNSYAAMFMMKAIIQRHLDTECLSPPMQTFTFGENLDASPSQVLEKLQMFLSKC